jgi:membrane-bound lytic murein transglycosylase D
MNLKTLLPLLGLFTVLALCSVKLLKNQRTVYSLDYHTYDLPEAISFAGEPVPLHITDVKERLDREVLVNAYFHSNTLLALKRCYRWLPEVEKILAEQQIPDDFKYLALAESLLGNAVSPAGAVGVWQLMPETAKALKLRIDEEVDERYNLQKATVAACSHLRSAKAQFGSWTLAAAAYNRGNSGIQKALEKQQVTSYYDLFMNDETTRYLFRILALKIVLEHPEQYGFEVPEPHRYLPHQTTAVPVTQSIPDLVTYAKEKGLNYKLLRLHNPWVRAYSLTVPAGSTGYVLHLPQKP